MKVTISLRGHLIKQFGGEQERVVEIPENTTAEEALQAIGVDWRTARNFGFVAINSHKVLITAQLKDGDQLKAYPKISGG